MPRKFTNNASVRQIGNRAKLSMGQGSEYARKCLGLALAASLFEGVPVYAKCDPDMRQVKLKFYLDDGAAEGWADLGEPVRDDLAFLLEEAFSAKLADKFYEACGDRPAEQPAEAAPARRLGRTKAPAPSEAPEGS